MTDAQKRLAYINRYGKPVWDRAVSLAGHHRQNARKHYRINTHFTAFDWLDRCDFFGLVCPMCVEAPPVSPHHRRQLHQGGGNTIDNILPLCMDCHKVIHEYGFKTDPDWLTDQLAFEPGGLVLRCHFGYVLSRIFVITSVVPPQLQDQPPVRYEYVDGIRKDRSPWHSRCGLALDGHRLSFWYGAIVHIQGGLGGDHVARFVPERWLQDQSRLYDKFIIGDEVTGHPTFRERGEKRVILEVRELLPAEPYVASLKLVPARAVVVEAGRHSEPTIIPLERLWIIALGRHGYSPGGASPSGTLVEAPSSGPRGADT